MVPSATVAAACVDHGVDAGSALTRRALGRGRRRRGRPGAGRGGPGAAMASPARTCCSSGRSSPARTSLALLAAMARLDRPDADPGGRRADRLGRRARRRRRQGWRRRWPASVTCRRPTCPRCTPVPRSSASRRSRRASGSRCSRRWRRARRWSPRPPPRPPRWPATLRCSSIPATRQRSPTRSARVLDDPSVAAALRAAGLRRATAAPLDRHGPRATLDVYRSVLDR